MQTVFIWVWYGKALVQALVQALFWHIAWKMNNVCIFLTRSSHDIILPYIMLNLQLECDMGWYGYTYHSWNHSTECENLYNSGIIYQANNGPNCLKSLFYVCSVGWKFLEHQICIYFKYIRKYYWQITWYFTSHCLVVKTSSSFLLLKKK